MKLPMYAGRGIPGRKELEYLAEWKSLYSEDDRPFQDVEMCKRLESALRGGVRTAFSADNKVFWEFHDGRLAAMTTSLKGSDFSKDIAEMTGRIGAEPHIESSTQMNGYGARWEMVTATWFTPAAAAMIVFDPNPVDPQLTLTMETMAVHEETVQQAMNRKSALDR